MAAFIHKLRLIVTDGDLMRRLGFVLAALVVFRILAVIPVPGVNVDLLEQFFQNNQFLSFLSIFSGGGLSGLSIVMLGVGPYITGSIIMQLATVLSIKLKALYQDEGELGRKRFSQYGRLLSVPLAALQAGAFLYYFETQGLIVHLSLFAFAANIAVVTAGSVLLMWIGELISEFGIGNGVSIIIFAGIVAGLPQILTQVLFTFDPSQIPLFIALIAAGLAITLGVVYISEAERPVPVTYAKRVVGNRVTGGVQTYVPLRLNQAGVMPIIFALSLLVLPGVGLNFLSQIGNATVANWAQTLLTFPGSNVVYAASYFLLVVIFTYFFTAVTFDPARMATNLQKNGAFVAGIRPGAATAEYLGDIITRITFVGALFLGVIAVLPLVLQEATGFTTFAIGGTALLIVVSVILDIVRKIDAQTSLREY